MRSFFEFIKICESYRNLPKGRMDLRAARTAATGLGHLGVASAVIGAENAIGEVGDLPDEIARASIERSVRPLERASRIVQTRLSHSPERSQKIEQENREKGKKP